MKIEAKFSHQTMNFVAYVWIRGSVQHKLYVPRFDFRFSAPDQVTFIKDGKYIEHEPESEILREQNKVLKSENLTLSSRLAAVETMLGRVNAALRG